MRIKCYTCGKEVEEEEGNYILITTDKEDEFECKECTEAYYDRRNEEEVRELEDGTKS